MVLEVVASSQCPQEALVGSCGGAEDSCDLRLLELPTSEAAYL